MVFYSWKQALCGGLIYGTGDTIAELISGEFLISRLLGMVLTGATMYALEIPNYFRWIDRHFHAPDFKTTVIRALLALAYFNPLWIARHIVFILIFSGQWALIDSDILLVAAESFLCSIPITLSANFLIQNGLPLSWRFMASAVFSGLMAVYYALSEVLFG